MIVTELEDFERYFSLHPLFKKVATFLKENDCTSLAQGRTDIIGEELYVNHLRFETFPREGVKLEMHREYIDIHVPLAGKELFGWKAQYDIRKYSKNYSYDDDCALSEEECEMYVTLSPGMIAIVWPEDAHAPGMGEDVLDKLVIKVRI